jgi:hypothetical protein
MTVPIPPTSGPEDPSIRLAEVETSTIMEIEAPLPDLSAMTENAVSAGKAWCAGASEWATSPQGAGEGGFTLGGATAGEWDSNVSFPHEGP